MGVSKREITYRAGSSKCHFHVTGLSQVGVSVFDEQLSLETSGIAKVSNVYISGIRVSFSSVDKNP